VTRPRNTPVFQSHNFHTTGVNKFRSYMVEVETCIDMFLLRSSSMALFMPLIKSFLNFISKACTFKNDVEQAPTKSTRGQEILNLSTFNLSREVRLDFH